MQRKQTTTQCFLNNDIDDYYNDIESSKLKHDNPKYVKRWVFVVQEYYNNLQLISGLIASMFPVSIYILATDDYSENVYSELPFIAIWSLSCFFMAAYLFAGDAKEMHLYNNVVTFKCSIDHPDFIYKLAPYFSIIGGMVCLIALFYVGPSAFVGAGAYALVSLRLYNAKKEYTYSHFLINNLLYLDYHRKSDTLYVYYTNVHCVEKEDSIYLCEIMNYEVLNVNIDDLTFLINYIEERKNFKVDVKYHKKSSSRENPWDVLKSYNYKFHNIKIDKKTRKVLSENFYDVENTDV